MVCSGRQLIGLRVARPATARAAAARRPPLTANESVCIVLEPPAMNSCAPLAAPVCHSRPGGNAPEAVDGTTCSKTPSISVASEGTIREITRTAAAPAAWGAMASARVPEGPMQSTTEQPRKKALPVRTGGGATLDPKIK